MPDGARTDLPATGSPIEEPAYTMALGQAVALRLTAYSVLLLFLAAGRVGPPVPPGRYIGRTARSRAVLSVR